MTQTSIFCRTPTGLVLALGLAAALPSIEAAAPERFVATAVSIATPGPTGAGTVEMVVERYSTDEERDQLLKAVLDKGPEKLLDTLQRMPRVGYIRTPNSIGYDLKYAQKMPLDEGGDQIILDSRQGMPFFPGGISVADTGGAGSDTLDFENPAGTTITGTPAGGPPFTGGEWRGNGQGGSRFGSDPHPSQ